MRCFWKFSRIFARPPVLEIKVALLKNWTDRCLSAQQLSLGLVERANAFKTDTADHAHDHSSDNSARYVNIRSPELGN